MNLPVGWVAEPWIQRMGWVLIHFLWEGTVIALGLAVVLRILAKVSSQVRYALIVAAFLLCAAAPMMTWMVMAPHEEILSSAAFRPVDLPMSGEQAAAPVVSVPMSGGEAVVRQDAPWQDRLARAADGALPYVVGLWSLGVVLLSGRLMLGWVWMQRLCRSSIPVADLDCRERFERLRSRMRISRPVRLLESALVEVPTLIGWLRPVILIPTALFVGMTPDQLEAIFAHELAHVRRYDYAVNLLQTFIETILFYHPAVWWISRKLREERENCCDDLALEIMQDRLVYVSALAQLEEKRVGAMMLTASGGSLLQRIRRIAGVSDRKASAWPWWVLVIVVLSVGCLTRLKAAPDQDAGAVSSWPPPDLSKSIGFYPLESLGEINRPVDPELNAAIDHLKLTSLDIPVLPLHLYLDEMAKVLKQQNPDSPQITFILMSPEEPHPISFHLQHPATLREVLNQLNEQYPLRYQIRGATDIIVWQVASYETLFTQRARETRIDLDLDHASLAEALQAVQIAAAHQGFQFNVSNFGDSRRFPSAAPHNITLKQKQITLDEALRYLLTTTQTRLFYQREKNHPPGEYYIEPAQPDVPMEEVRASGASFGDLNAQMLAAVQKSDAAAVQKLIDQGADPNAGQAADGMNALLSAVQSDHIAMVRLLLKNGGDPNCKNGDRDLFALSYAKNAAMVKVLLDAGADPNGKKGLITPLMDAPDPESVRLLVQHGAQVNPKLSDGRTLLENAVGNEIYERSLGDRWDVIAEMIKQGAAFDPRGNGPTLLTDAAQEGKINIARGLIDAGVSPDAYATRGIFIFFPLEDAAFARSPDMIKLLLSRGAHFSACRGNTSPLSTALYYSRYDNVSVLRQAGENDVGYLSEYCARGNLAKVTELLKAGANVNETDAFGVTPLMYAIHLGHPEIVRVLFEQGANINQFNLAGTTPYTLFQGILASFNQYPGAVQDDWGIPGSVHADEAKRRMTELESFFKLHPSDPNYQNASGSTALHQAALAGATGGLDQLLALRPDVNAKDHNGNTPLLLAALSPLAGNLATRYVDKESAKEWNAEARIADQLIKAGAKLDLVMADGKTVGESAMAAAIKAKNPQLISVLHEAGVAEEASPKASDEVTGTKATDADAPASDVDAQMLAAVKKGDAVTVQKLMDQGADAKAVDKYGDTLLFDAGSPEVAEILIAKGVDPKVRNQSGTTALSRLCLNGGDNTAVIVRVLLQHGADPNSRGGELKTTPIMGPRDGATVDVLMEFGADIKATDSEGDNALYWGTWQKASTCEALLRHGVPFDPQKDGPTYLMYAAQHNNVPTATWLLDHGVDPNLKGTWEKGVDLHNTPLNTAAKDGSEEVAKLLLQRGAKVTDELVYALDNQHPRIAKLIWDSGARTVSGLCYQISQGATLDDVQKLLDQGIPADPPQDQYITPLGVAAGLGRMDVVQLLVERGADVNKGAPLHPNHPDYKPTPLITAAEAGQDEIVDYLLLHGAQPTPKAVYVAGDRAVSFPGQRSEDHFVKIVQRLIDAGALKNATPEQAGEVLSGPIFAGGKGNASVLKMLLDAGLSPDLPMPPEHGQKPMSVLAYCRDLYGKHPHQYRWSDQFKILIDMMAEAEAKQGGKTTETNSDSGAIPSRNLNSQTDVGPTEAIAGSGPSSPSASVENHGSDGASKISPITLNFTLVEVTEKAYASQAAAMDEAVAKGNLEFFSRQKGSFVGPAAGVDYTTTKGWYSVGEVQSYIASSTANKQSGKPALTLQASSVFLGLNGDFVFSPGPSATSVDSVWQLTEPETATGLEIPVLKAGEPLPKTFPSPAFGVVVFKDKNWSIVSGKAHAFWVGKTLGQISRTAQFSDLSHASIREMADNKTPSRLAVFIIANPAGPAGSTGKTAPAAPAVLPSNASKDLTTLKKDLLAAKEDANARGVLVDSVQNLPDDRFVDTLTGLGRMQPEISSLRSEIAANQTDIETLLKLGFIEGHPRIEALRAMLATKQQKMKELVAGMRKTLANERQASDSQVALLTREVAGASTTAPPAAPTAPAPVASDKGEANDRKQRWLEAKEYADTYRVRLESVEKLPDGPFVRAMQGLRRSEPEISSLQAEIVKEQEDIANLLKDGLAENHPQVLAKKAELAAKQQAMMGLIAGVRQALVIENQMAVSRVALLGKEVADASGEHR